MGGRGWCNATLWLSALVCQAVLLASVLNVAKSNSDLPGYEVLDSDWGWPPLEVQRRGLESRGAASSAAGHEEDTEFKLVSEEDAAGPGSSGLSFTIFFADWCSRCDHLLPQYREVGALLTESEGVGFYEVNVDDASAVEAATAQRLGIDRYPTVVLFADGRPVGTIPTAYLQLAPGRVEALFTTIIDGDYSLLTPWTAASARASSNISRKRNRNVRSDAAAGSAAVRNALHATVARGAVNIADADDDAATNPSSLAAGGASGPGSQPSSSSSSSAGSGEPTGRFQQSHLILGHPMSFYKRQVQRMFGGISNRAILACILLVCVLVPVAIALLWPWLCSLSAAAHSSMDCRALGHDAFLARQGWRAATASALRLRAAVLFPKCCGNRFRQKMYREAANAARKAEASAVEGKGGVLSIEWMRAKSEVYRGLVSRNMQGIENADGHFVLSLPRQPTCVEEVSLPLRTLSLVRVVDLSKTRSGGHSETGGSSQNFKVSPSSRLSGVGSMLSPTMRPDFTTSFPALVNHIYKSVSAAVDRANAAAGMFLCAEDRGSRPTWDGDTPPIQISLFDPKGYRVPLLSVTRQPNGSGGSIGGRGPSGANAWPKKRLQNILGYKPAVGGGAPRSVLGPRSPRVTLNGVLLEFAGLHLTSGGEVWVLWQPVKQVSGRSVAWTAGVPSEKGNKKWRPAAVAQGLASLKVSPLRSSSPRVAAPSRVSPNLLETGPETKNRDTGGNGNAAAAAGVPFVRPRGGSVDPENDPTNVVLRPGVAKQPKFVPTNAVDVVRRSIWSENYSSFSAAPSLELYTPIMQLWVTAATAAAASPVTTPRAVLQNALGANAVSTPKSGLSSRQASLSRRPSFRLNQYVDGGSGTTAFTPRNIGAALKAAPSAGVEGGGHSRDRGSSFGGSFGLASGVAAGDVIPGSGLSTGGWRAKRRSDGVVRCLAAEVVPAVREVSESLLQDGARLMLPLRDSLTVYEKEVILDDNAQSVSIHVFDPIHSVRVRP